MVDVLNKILTQRAEVDYLKVLHISVPRRKMYRISSRALAQSGARRVRLAAVTDQLIIANNL